ncbi:unnamed protein product [Thlaspi arvense]|uniref:Uncharacterized protein n=1 Tax=Thlaspi arvense TaxID=13288 RepID=A0AAU9RVS8_THLAR|nr:unnamed protein product [Thlaspi arvense]
MVQTEPNQPNDQGREREVEVLGICASCCCFEVLKFVEAAVVEAVLRFALIYAKAKNKSGPLKAGLESVEGDVKIVAYNEVQRCFLTVGLVYPENLFTFLLSRLFEVWHPQRPLLVDVARSLLEEQSLSVRKALSELIVVMASHCYLVGPSGELFVEYLVRHAAVEEIDNLKYILWPFLLKMIIPRVYTGAIAILLFLTLSNFLFKQMHI